MGIVILIFIKISESYANELMLNSRELASFIFADINWLFFFGILMVLASKQKLLSNTKPEDETI